MRLEFGAELSISMRLRSSGQGRGASDVEKARFGSASGAGEQEGAGHVVDKDGIAQLAAVAEDFDGLAEQREPEETREKSLAGNVERQARAVDVGQIEDYGVDAAHRGVEQMIFGRGGFMDAVDIDGAYRV